MTARYKFTEPSLPAPTTRNGGSFFPGARNKAKLLPSGCALLDCVLGGGWAVGRVVNIVGDRSTGKTLLAIEACANLINLHPKGWICYREAEAAFDEQYARALGLDLKRVDFGPNGLDTQWATVEDIFDDLEKQLNKHKRGGHPGLYIIDSLDALTTRAALKRGIDEASYGLEKQNLLSVKLFAGLIRKIREANCCLMIISQVREIINPMFGEKYRRAGGKALSFYVSQEVWLSHIKRLAVTRGGMKRATGVVIRALCKKNKVTVAFRECEFTLRFNFGVDDIEASVAWLQEARRTKLLGLTTASDVEKFLIESANLPPKEYQKRAREVREVVIRAWDEVEESFLPKHSKYG